MYTTLRRHIQEDCNINIYLHEKLKSANMFLLFISPITLFILYMPIIMFSRLIYQDA
jgi:hypothetical protein